MKENLMNAETSKTEKIKTHYARIVVDGTSEKPYYSIEWFDPVRKEYFIGYSSYSIENVFNWLSECFEIVEAAKTNADRIRAMSDEEMANRLCCRAWCPPAVKCKRGIGGLAKPVGSNGSNSLQINYKKLSKIIKKLLTNKQGCGNIYSQGDNKG